MATPDGRGDASTSEASTPDAGSGSRVVSVAAVDLGATSGRVMLARVGPGTLDLSEMGRFPNHPIEVDGTLHWDVLALWSGIVDGLAAAVAAAGGGLAAIGIDSWAVDYGLLDADGALLGNPIHYRDARTDGQVDAVFEVVPAGELYAITGLQVLPINTVYQLAAARGSAQLAAAHQLLLIPDLLARWLTGRSVAEVTNASTTQLFDVAARAWSDDLVDRLGLDRSLLPELVEPGTVVGPVLAGMRDRLGLDDAQPPLPVVAVGTHDTASAIVGVPATDKRFAYISCGTWSLVGVELDEPVLTEASRRANFTNELGVDGTVRYLRNVMGLWLLSESQRTWQDQGREHALEVLLAGAAEVEPRRSLVDPDDARFLAPGDMPARIAAVCRDSGQPVPQTPAQFTRCILDSLAVAYRRTVADAAALSGHAVDVVHVVGGGSRNALLCQLTADACRLPVVAGPVEATAIGNALVQARALGALDGDLADLRRLVRSTSDLQSYEPIGDPAGWDDAVDLLRTGADTAVAH